MINPASRPKRILVIRLSSLGDILLASLTLRSLRRAFPDARIDMVVKSAFVEVLNGFPELDHRYKKTPLGVYGEGERVWLKKCGYDMVVDLHNNLRSRRLTHRTRARRVFRYHRPRLGRLLRIKSPTLRSKLTVPPPVALGYLSTLADLHVHDDGGGLNLEVLPEWRQDMRRRLTDYNLSLGLDAHAKPVILAPGARHATKRWLPDRWREFIGMLPAAGYRSIVMVGLDLDRTLCDELAQGSAHPVLNLAGETSIGELAGIISLGAALVTGDSAPLHIAASVGTPVVAIFGATVPEFGFAPFRCRSVILQVEGLSCRPCHKHGTERCPKGHFRCMTEIAPPRVLDALQQMTSPSENAPIPLAVQNA